MRTFNILSGDHDEYLIVTPAKEEVVKDLKEFKLKNKRQLPDEPRSSASSGLPAENESVKPSLDEDPKPKRARESCVYCIGKCVCADIKPSEQHSFSDTKPCKLCDAPMCLK